MDQFNFFMQNKLIWLQNLSSPQKSKYLYLNIKYKTIYKTIQEKYFSALGFGGKFLGLMSRNPKNENISKF